MYIDIQPTFDYIGHRSADRYRLEYESGHRFSHRGHGMRASAEGWIPVSEDCIRDVDHHCRSRSPHCIGHTAGGRISPGASRGHSPHIIPSTLTQAFSVEKVKRVSTSIQTEEAQSLQRAMVQTGTSPISIPEGESVPKKGKRAKEAQTDVASSRDSEDDSEDDEPSPDLGKLSEALPISPSEDIRTYADLIRKVAMALGLSLGEPKSHVSDVVFEVLHRDIAPIVSLPLSSVLLQSIQTTWIHPASAPTSTKRLDQMYRIQESSAQFLYAHPKPNSLIISSSAKGRRVQSAPQDRDGKRIDVFGRWFYSTGALAIKASNYLACISRFLFAILEDFSPILPLLPDDVKAKALQMQADGIAASKQLIATSKHVLESSARTLSTAVALRRFGWLRSTALSSYTKAIIEDLAFDGLGLFNAETDATLRRLDKDIKASRSLGISSRPTFKRRPYYSWKKTQQSPDRYSRPSSSSSSCSSWQNRNKGQAQKQQRAKQQKQAKTAA